MCCHMGRALMINNILGLRYDSYTSRYHFSGHMMLIVFVKIALLYGNRLSNQTLFKLGEYLTKLN